MMVSLSFAQFFISKSMASVKTKQDHEAASDHSLTPSPSSPNTLNTAEQRTQFISSRHDAILKQFSSSHYMLSLQNNEDTANHNNTNSAHPNDDSKESDHSVSSARSSTASSHSGVDVSSPQQFEFPFYVASTRKSLCSMKEGWAKGDRVCALKIAIRQSRLLIDRVVLSEPQFFPAIYVLVSRLLRTFGDLVFERLDHMRKTQSATRAQTTCANWFYKVGTHDAMLRHNC